MDDDEELEEQIKRRLREDGIHTDKLYSTNEAFAEAGEGTTTQEPCRYAREEGHTGEGCGCVPPPETPAATRTGEEIVEEWHERYGSLIASGTFGYLTPLVSLIDSALFERIVKAHHGLDDTPHELYCPLKSETGVTLVCLRCQLDGRWARSAREDMKQVLLNVRVEGPEDDPCWDACAVLWEAGKLAGGTHTPDCARARDAVKAP